MKDFNIKKLYYSISEVSKITEVEQYVLRYWETEFEQLNPQKNRAGNRAYTNKDIELILMIKSLLREKKYTIEGAKKVLFDNLLQQKKIEQQTTAIEKEPTLFESTIPSTKSDEPSLKSDLLELKLLLEYLLKKI